MPLFWLLLHVPCWDSCWPLLPWPPSVEHATLALGVQLGTAPLVCQHSPSSAFLLLQGAAPLINFRGGVVHCALYMMMRSNADRLRPIVLSHTLYSLLSTLHSLRSLVTCMNKKCTSPSWVLLCIFLHALTFSSLHYGHIDHRGIGFFVLC